MSYLAKVCVTIQKPLNTQTPDIQGFVSVGVTRHQLNYLCVIAPKSAICKTR
jgi:hypothetical protein